MPRSKRTPPISRRGIAGRLKSGGANSKPIWKPHSLDHRSAGCSAKAVWQPPVASYQRGLLTSQGEAKGEHWDHILAGSRSQRNWRLARLWLPATSKGRSWQRRFRATAGFRCGKRLTRRAFAGVRLALEFQARAALPNNLQSAAALVADCNSPNLGICLDLFHYTTGPSKPEDLAHLFVEGRIFSTSNYGDMAGPLRELATDADRVLPGDGEFSLEPLVSRHRARKSTTPTPVSVELTNPATMVGSPATIRRSGHHGATPSARAGEHGLTVVATLPSSPWTLSGIIGAGLRRGSKR